MDYFHNTTKVNEVFESYIKSNQIKLSLLLWLCLSFLHKQPNNTQEITHCNYSAQLTHCLEDMLNSFLQKELL